MTKRGENTRSSNEELIPGLPEECSMHCLIRVLHKCISSMKGVCKKWREILLDKNSLLYEMRISQSLTEPSIFLIPDIHLKMGDRTKFYACLPYKSDVLIVGGTISGESTPEYWIVDTITRRIRKGPNMLTCLANFSCAIVGARMYTFGGYIMWDDERLQTDGVGHPLVKSEYYDFELQAWNSISPVPFSLWGSRSCYADSNSVPSRIFLRGTLLFTRGSSDHYAESTQWVTLQYCIASDSWTEIEGDQSKWSIENRWYRGQKHALTVAISIRQATN